MDWDALLELAWDHPVPVLVTVLIVLSGAVHVTVIVIELLTLFVKHLTGQLIEGRTALRHLHAALIRLRAILQRDAPAAHPPDPESRPPQRPTSIPRPPATDRIVESYARDVSE